MSKKRKEEQGVLVEMVRAPQSSELNIKESVRDYEKRLNDLRQPTSREDLSFKDLPLSSFKHALKCI